jgi:hypothetical protein
MEKTYRVACSYVLMRFVQRNGIIYDDWEPPLDEFVDSTAYASWRFNKEESLPAVNLYECTVKASEPWFERVLEMLEAEEIPCRHHYPIEEKKVSFNLWVNVCTNCEKELATFNKVYEGITRRIKF